MYFLQDGDTEEFRRALRMSPEVYNELLTTLTPALQKKHTNCRPPVSPEVRLALTLRYLVHGESFLSLSEHFRVGRSTAGLIMKETCQAIIDILMDDYLVTPSTTEDWLKVSSEFQTRWNFPHLLGAVDGKHIRIVAPSKSGSYYFNYKEYHSIVLMAVANANYEFIFVDAGAEGRASDGGIWAKCGLKTRMDSPQNPLNIPQPSPIPGIQGDIPFFLVGDDAFKLNFNLMKPYPGQNLNRMERIFNYRLSRCRRIIENCFGIMVARFKIFQRAIEVEPDAAQNVTLACCILHNYLRRKSTNYVTPTTVDNEMSDGTIVPGTWRHEARPLNPLQIGRGRNPSRYAKEVRNKLKDYFVTPEGEVQWQYADD